MAKKVNLDAFIPREDFDINLANDRLTTRKTTLGIHDLKHDGFFFSELRKPDFQRETNEWDSKKITDLIYSFLNGDLIPALILWKSVGSYIFVIDGSHRLSALASWINDDFGDGNISKKYFNEIIPEAQNKIASITRDKVNKIIGPFSDYELALTMPEKVDPEIVEKSKRLGALGLQVQWVEGDSSKAETSFFNINCKAQPINKTEIRLLKERRKPNGISTRAIVRSGTGHKYWSSFKDKIQDEIEKTASEINHLLFSPPISTPIKTLNLPIGGNIINSQSQSLVLDYVEICNGKTDKDEKDESGEKTLNYLKKCRKIALRLTSNHSGSLGLHPIIYFYSQTGRHKPASFYAITSLIMELEKTNKLNDFIKVRNSFEELLLTYDDLIQQIVRRHRGALASQGYIKLFLLLCLKKLEAGKSIQEIGNEIIKHKDYKYLTLNKDEFEVQKKDFSSSVKSATYIQEALSNSIRCGICNGFIDDKAITIDHIVRKEDGGTGRPDNAQLTHPYCNSTYKN